MPLRIPGAEANARSAMAANDAHRAVEQRAAPGWPDGPRLDGKSLEGQTEAWVSLCTLSTRMGLRPCLAYPSGKLWAGERPQGGALLAPPFQAEMPGTPPA